MASRILSSVGRGFQRYFVRGLGIVLPTALTIWLAVVLYQFVQDYVSEPINAGVKEAILRFTDYPRVTTRMQAEERHFLEHAETEFFREADLEARIAYRSLPEHRRPAFLEQRLRRAQLNREWHRYRWIADLTGLVLAVLVVYGIGLMLGSYLGRRLYERTEAFIGRVPLVRRVYPSVKQVTDFFVGEGRPTQEQFSRVIAVQYPRKGIWSVGLVTGTTMQVIEDSAEVECLTVFIPSAPTPFTGYVITVPKADSVDLPISLEEALKFTISLGVLVPPHQQVHRPEDDPPYPTWPDEPGRP